MAGYFSKVVQLLINRKQKQIVPYIVADENKVIENMLLHVYSRSVSEVIHRFLHIPESNFDDDISAKIAEKKQLIMSQLIEKLACKNEDETSMNAAFVLQDIMEQKSFFQILTRRQNLQRMYDIAFNKDDCSDAESAWTTQGLIARFVQQFNEKQKQTNHDDFDSDNDDDLIVNEMDDAEKEDSKARNNQQIVELLVSMVEPIKVLL